MKYEKVFVIGFNKTATSTFHILFEMNGLKSQHDGSHWDTDAYQCFSDNGNKRDWRQLYFDYPNSIFILNTRPLDDWIRSRAKHCYIEKLAWGYPPRVNLYKRWILERKVVYLDIVRFFTREPSKLTIIDISQDLWLRTIADKLGIEAHNLSINEGSKLVPKSHLEEVNDRMAEAMNDLCLTVEERSGSFIAESLLSALEATEVSRLIQLYEHNLPEVVTGD